MFTSYMKNFIQVTHGSRPIQVFLFENVAAFTRRNVIQSKRTITKGGNNRIVRNLFRKDNRFQKLGIKENPLFKSLDIILFRCE